MVAAINSDGMVDEYVDGMQTYGNNATGVQVSGEVFAVQTKDGRTEEYVEGMQGRTY
jgi:hypothetical protein